MTNSDRREQDGVRGPLPEPRAGARFSVPVDRTESDLFPAPAASAAGGAVPVPRVRMVSAGTHFAPAGAASPSRPSPSVSPDSSRRAAPAPAADDSVWVPRPVGARFAPAEGASAGPGKPAGDGESARRRIERRASANPFDTAQFLIAAGCAPSAPAPSAASVPASPSSPAPSGAPFPRTANSAAPSAADAMNRRPESARGTAPAAPLPHAVPRPAAPAPSPVVAPSAPRPAATPQAPSAPHPAPAGFPGGIAAPAPEPSFDAAVTGRIPMAQTAPGLRSGQAPVAPVRAYRAAAPGSASVPHGGYRPARAAADREPPQPPRKKKGGALSIILIVVGVALLLVAGGLFIKAQIGYKQAESTYAELQRYAVSADEGDGVPQVDFASLAAINPDIVGWIYAPGTPINYPVVQTDDNTTYLTRLFDLSGNGSGTIFMDMDDTAPGMVDQQTTLYGHHMNDGKMFKVVDNTLDQGSFDAFPYVYYITPDVTYKLKPLMTAQVEDTYVDARKTNFTGEGESLQAYLTDMLGHAKAKAADAEGRIAETDQVMSLVTCAGEIIPRTTRAVMVLTVEETTARQ